MCGEMFTCRSWESCKEKLQHYRRREPERSALYQLVYHGRDKLARVWEERFQATYGVLRDEILETFDAYLNCGILEHGAARRKNRAKHYFPHPLWRTTPLSLTPSVVPSTAL